MIVFRFCSRGATMGNLAGRPIRPNTFCNNRLRKRARLASTWQTRLFSAPSPTRQPAIEGVHLRNCLRGNDLDDSAVLDGDPKIGYTRPVVSPAQESSSSRVAPLLTTFRRFRIFENNNRSGTSKQVPSPSGSGSG